MAHHGRLKFKREIRFSSREITTDWALPKCSYCSMLEKQKQSADTCALKRFPGHVADPVQELGYVLTTRTGLHTLELGVAGNLNIKPSRPVQCGHGGS